MAAYERLVPHLATRRDVRVPPRGLNEADYVLIRNFDNVALPPDRYELIDRDRILTLWRRLR